MWVLFLPMSRKGLAHDVFDIFATYSGPAPGAMIVVQTVA